jgi:hypothetical protein
VSGNEAMNRILRGKAPREPEADEAPGPAEIDAGARGVPGPEATDMNLLLRRAAGLGPPFDYRELRRDQG